MYDFFIWKATRWVMLPGILGKTVPVWGLHATLDGKPLKHTNVRLRLYLNIQKHLKFHASFLSRLVIEYCWRMPYCCGFSNGSDSRPDCSMLSNSRSRNFLSVAAWLDGDYPVLMYLFLVRGMWWLNILPGNGKTNYVGEYLKCKINAHNGFLQAFSLNIKKIIFTSQKTY
jgi:hypothetical protein